MSCKHFEAVPKTFSYMEGWHRQEPVIPVNECTKVQNPRRPRVRESLKAYMLNLIYNAHARMLERHVRLKLKVGSVHCWKQYAWSSMHGAVCWSSMHVCTPSCSNRWCFAVLRTAY